MTAVDYLAAWCLASVVLTVMWAALCGSADLDDTSDEGER